MSEQVLLRFLSNGLIDVGGDDAKLEKLKATSRDLATSLKENAAKAASFALIAFDPDAPVSDPVIQEAAQALEKQWPTYVNTFRGGTPIAVIRAMLLDALVQASADDHNIAVAFVACARNVLPFMEVGGEQVIWSDEVKRIEEHVDERAEREWATPSKIDLEPLTIKTTASLKLTVSQAKLDKADLQTKISAASGPGVANANPHWPNNPQPWAQQFAPKLADAIAEAIESAKTTVTGGDLSAPFQQLTQAVNNYVGGAMSAFAAATSGLQRRTNLIWWREALFSPTSKSSYRKLPPSVAAGMMALDLFSQVPTFSPASVAAFLSETVIRLPGLVADQPHTIGSLSDELRTDQRLMALRETAKGLVSASGGRGFLLTFVGNLDPSVKVDDETFKKRVGVSLATEITLPQWSVWLFRELQASRATKAGSTASRAARKAEEK
jgi:hypothetical protein